MYLGIGVHKRYAQVAVMDKAGTIIEEVHVKNANLDDLAQRYAGEQAVLEATPTTTTFTIRCPSIWM
jgi:hypothetical protein